MVLVQKVLYPVELFSFDKLTIEIHVLNPPATSNKLHLWSQCEVYLATSSNSISKLYNSEL